VTSDNPRFFAASERAVISISGPERTSFLQGIVSNDVTRIARDRAIWSALLTPQGKYLHDFQMVELGEGDDAKVLIDCEAERLSDLFRRLRMYKLRAQANLVDASAEYDVFCVFGEKASNVLGVDGEAGSAAALADGVAFVDARHPALGLRVILPKGTGEQTLSGLGCFPGDRADFERQRITLSIPDGSRDMVIEKAILLENGFDELGGVSWKKGCFVGQELTARTKYRGLIKKRLLPVEITGPVPESGTQITSNGKDAGELRSTIQSDAGVMGLALLRLEALQGGEPMVADGSTLTPTVPDWVQLPEAKS